MKGEKAKIKQGKKKVVKLMKNRYNKDEKKKNREKNIKKDKEIRQRGVWNSWPGLKQREVI